MKIKFLLDNVDNLDNLDNLDNVDKVIKVIKGLILSALFLDNLDLLGVYCD